MDFPKNFIRATTEFNKPPQIMIPAPYLRKCFTVENTPESAEIVITGLGFYRLFINGTEITKGPLAPYISNPDDIICYDKYDIEPLITKGKNAIGIILGNGMFNEPAGTIWHMERARWRGAPQTALRLTLTDSEGNETVIESDESFRAAESPIRYDDLRHGEHYDARCEIDGWSTPDFDDSAWRNAISAPCPCGVPRFTNAEPITVSEELKPVLITKQQGGWLYDFGVNIAGLCRLKIDGTAGQTVELIHGEKLIDGELTLVNIVIDKSDKLWHIDRYTCSGKGTEEHIPSFTYHGFRYVLVKGIEESQATKGLLTAVVMHSDVKKRGGFTCSDPLANKIQEATVRSDLANFYYFPTDCPQREKNGWTADAALSTEQMLFNLTVENSLKEWMVHIRPTLNQEGSIPSIIPTAANWGYNMGPAWDDVLVWVPYYLYKYTDDKGVISDNASSVLRYLNYLTTHRNGDGLIDFGLGDWCHVGRLAGEPKAPVIVTSSIISFDFAMKAKLLFDEAGMLPESKYAAEIADTFRADIRRKLIDFDTMRVYGDCQTCQAMALYYGIFEENERLAAFDELISLIEKENGHFDIGVLGARVLFHVLSDFGRSDLAYDMIVGPAYPSYGYWIKRGATSLWESFWDTENLTDSLNHHFWGDVSHWFISHVGGIAYNPDLTDKTHVDICPEFIEKLDFAEAWFESIYGSIEVEWKRDTDGIALKINLPDEMHGKIKVGGLYAFESGENELTLASGEYRLLKKEA